MGLAHRFGLNGWHGGTVVSTAASQRQGPWFNSWLGSMSVQSLHFLPCVCVGFLRVLRFPPTVQKTCWLRELARTGAGVWRLGEFHINFIAVLM